MTLQPKIWIPDPLEAWQHDNRRLVTQAELAAYSNLGKLTSVRDEWRNDLLDRHHHGARTERGQYAIRVVELSRQSLTWAAAEEILSERHIQLLRDNVETKIIEQLRVTP